MNFLPDMQHVEVIALAGILAVTVFTVVTVCVSATVYLATRERAPSHQPATSRSAVPALATSAAEPARSSVLATAG